MQQKQFLGVFFEKNGTAKELKLNFTTFNEINPNFGFKNFVTGKDIDEKFNAILFLQSLMNGNKSNQLATFKQVIENKGYIEDLKKSVSVPTSFKKGDSIGYNSYFSFDNLKNPIQKKFENPTIDKGKLKTLIFDKILNLKEPLEITPNKFFNDKTKIDTESAEFYQNVANSINNLYLYLHLYDKINRPFNRPIEDLYFDIESKLQNLDLNKEQDLEIFYNTILEANKIINIYRKEIYLPAYESIIELQSEAQPIDLEPKNELPDTEPLEEVTEDNQEAAAEKKAETETEKIKYANKFLNSFNCSVNDIEKELMKLHISNLNDIQESRTYFGKESSGEFKKIIRDIFIVKNNTTADEFRNIIKTKAIDISNLLKNGNSFFVYNQIKETPKVNSELNIILEHTDRKKMMELWKDKLPQNIEYKIYSNNLLIYNSTDKKMVNPISLYKEFINPNSQNHYSDFTKFLLDNELTTYDKIDNAIKQNKILYLKNQPLNLDNYVINNIHQNKRLTSLGISQDTINDLKDVLKWGNNKQVLAKLDIDKQFFYLMYLYKNSENKVHYLELANSFKSNSQNNKLDSFFKVSTNNDILSKPEFTLLVKNPLEAIVYYEYYKNQGINVDILATGTKITKEQNDYINKLISESNIVKVKNSEEFDDYQVIENPKLLAENVIDKKPLKEELQPNLNNLTQWSKFFKLDSNNEIPALKAVIETNLNQFGNMKQGLQF